MRGWPPVARTSFVYGTVLPDAVVTALVVKSTPVTSSEMVSMPASAYHSRGRQSNFDASAIRAFESLVRSMTKSDSLETMVIWPGYFSSRSVCTTPMVPLPLYAVRAGQQYGPKRYSPADNNDFLLGLGNSALENRVSLSEFDIGLCGTDIDGTALFEDLVFVQSIESGRIFNIAGANIEACCYQLVLTSLGSRLA